MITWTVRNSVFVYNKTEANLQRIFNSYVWTTTQSLFPETVGTFWWNPVSFYLELFKRFDMLKIYNFLGHPVSIWFKAYEVYRTQRQYTLSVWRSKLLLNTVSTQPYHCQRPSVTSSVNTGSVYYHLILHHFAIWFLR